MSEIEAKGDWRLNEGLHWPCKNPKNSHHFPSLVLYTGEIICCSRYSNGGGPCLLNCPGYEPGGLAAFE